MIFGDLVGVPSFSPRYICAPPCPYPPALAASARAISQGVSLAENDTGTSVVPVVETYSKIAMDTLDGGFNPF